MNYYEKLNYDRAICGTIKRTQLYIWLVKATAVNGTNVRDTVMSFSPSVLPPWATLGEGRMPTLAFAKTALAFKCPSRHPPKNPESSPRGDCMERREFLLGGRVYLACVMKISTKNKFFLNIS